MITDLKQTERGWGGHFCDSFHCLFRRNTLLEYYNLKIVISTMGAWHPLGRNNEAQEIGSGRHYETVVFHALTEDGYNDIDIKKGQIEFESDWKTERLEDDLLANTKHDLVVKEIRERLLEGML